MSVLKRREFKCTWLVFSKSSYILKVHDYREGEERLGKKLLEGGSRLEREGLRENSRRDEVKKTEKKIEKIFSLAFGCI